MKETTPPGGIFVRGKIEIGRSRHKTKKNSRAEEEGEAKALPNIWKKKRERALKRGFEAEDVGQGKNHSTRCATTAGKKKSREGARGERIKGTQQGKGAV